MFEHLEMYTSALEFSLWNRKENRYWPRRNDHQNAENELIPCEILLFIVCIPLMRYALFLDLHWLLSVFYHLTHTHTYTQLMFCYIHWITLKQSYQWIEIECWLLLHCSCYSCVYIKIHFQIKSRLFILFYFLCAFCITNDGYLYFMPIHYGKTHISSIFSKRLLFFAKRWFGFISWNRKNTWMTE